MATMVHIWPVRIDADIIMNGQWTMPHEKQNIQQICGAEESKTKSQYQ